jgi:hypothetical protein
LEGRLLKSILKNALDQQPLGTSTAPHDNIRGAEYFE